MPEDCPAWETRDEACVAFGVEAALVAAAQAAARSGNDIRVANAERAMANHDSLWHQGAWAFMNVSADKKYLVFSAIGVGLGHLMAAILCSAYYAYHTGRIFAMDMREFAYVKDDNHNAFFANFEVQVPADLEVITDLTVIEELKRDPDMHFVTLSTPLDVGNPFPNRVVMVPCLTPGAPFTPSVRRDDQVFRINLKAELAEALSRAMELPYWKRHVIGMHYRASVGELFDRMTAATVPDYDERYAVVKDNYVKTALELVEGRDPDSYAFMVASDDRAFVTEMKQRLPNSFSIGTIRIDQEFMAHIRANKHSLAILLDAVTDLWALSRCHQLIYTRSAFTQFAILNSAHLDETNTYYVHMPMFDEILQSVPVETAVDWARAAVRKIDISRMHYSRLHRSLVDALVRAGRPEEAAYAQQQADWHDQAAHAPEFDNPDAFAARAEQRAGKYGLALLRATRAVEQLSDNPYLFGGFGDSLSMLHLAHDQPHKAVDAARRAVELDPRDAFLHDHLGYILVRAGRYPEAELAFRNAISIVSDVPSFHVNHSDVLARMNRLEEAAAAAERAVSLGPTDANAHRALGEILARSENYSEAETAFRRAASFNKNDINITYRLSIALERQSKFDEAWAIAEDIAAEYPSNMDFRRRALSLLVKSSDKAAAEDKVRAELAASPADGFLHRALIDILTARGDTSGVLDALGAAAAAFPDDFEFPFRQGAALLAASRYAEAEAALRRAAALKFDDGGTHFLLSIAAERQEKFDDAIIEAVLTCRFERGNPERARRVVALAERFASAFAKRLTSVVQVVS